MEVLTETFLVQSYHAHAGDVEKETEKTRKSQQQQNNIF